MDLKTHWTESYNHPLPPFSRSLRIAPGYLLPQNKTDLPLWGCGQIGLVFFLKLYRGHTLYFQSVARQGCSRGCRRFYTPATNTARAGSGGIQGGPPPCAGGPGTRRSLAYLSQHLCCCFPLREKVGRGRRGGAPSPGECRGAQPLAKRPRVPHPSAER